MRWRNIRQFGFLTVAMGLIALAVLGCDILAERESAPPLPTPDIEATIVAGVATAVAARAPATQAPAPTAQSEAAELYPTPTLFTYETGVRARTFAENSLIERWNAALDSNDCVQMEQMLPEVAVFQDHRAYVPGEDHSGVAACYGNTGSYHAALRLSDEAIRLNPTEAEFRAYRASTHHDLGQCDSAESDANAALGYATQTDVPGYHAHVQSFNILYLCAADREDYLTALPLAERTLELATRHGYTDEDLDNFQSDIEWLRQQVAHN